MKSQYQPAATPAPSAVTPRPTRWRGLRNPLTIAGILLLPMMWWIVTAAEIVDPLSLPPPRAVVAATRELWASGALAEHFIVSAGRILSGFVLGAVLGTVIGLAIGRYQLVADALEPLTDVLRQIAPVAWIPLAIIWFGFAEGSKVFIVALGSFFPIIVNTADGVRSVPSTIVHAATSLGAHRHHMFFKVLFPATLPSLFTGLTIGLGNAVRFVVAAELIGAQTGLGYMMMSARNVARTDIVIVGMIAMAVLGGSVIGTMRLLRSRFLHWVET